MPYAGDDGFVPDQFSADDFGDGFDPGSYSGGGPFMGGGRRWAVIAGADAMMVRTHYSQSTALDSTSFIQTNTGNIFNQKYTAFSPGYQGAFRTFIGLRDCCCGNEYRFGFMNLNAAQRLHSTTTTTSFDCDFLCNVAANPGDSINTGFNQGLSLFDFDVIRPFFFNPPCGDCCAPTCPVWDLRWFAGARIAYINQSINAIVTDATNVPTGIGFDDNASLKFTGGGLRMGMQGRRYLGATGRWSLYGRGAGSLLVGNINQHVSSFQPNGPANPIGGDSLITVSQHQSRIIPVAEIEAGATWWILPRFSVSGGWFLMSFWDLGMQVTGVNGNIGGGGGGVAPNNHPAIFDDSNILGFDGFFVRGELVF